jgi:RecB family exonuclease
VQIKTWSYSRLVEFEKCKFRAKLLYLDKIREPERPLPPGKTEQANDRGTRVHTAAELYVQSPQPIELLSELAAFAEEFEQLRTLYQEGKVSLEGEWGYNEGWQPVAWFSDDVWARVKLDALVMLEPDHAVVIDYKTGKKDGNEVKHADQMSLYQLSTFMRYPELEKVTVELWYLDQDALTRQVYTREQGMRHLKNFNKRGLAMTTCTDFPANPNSYTCKWCRLGPRGSGVCKVGK